MANKLTPSQQAIYGADQVEQDEVSNKELLIEKALEGLYTDINIEMITDFNDKLINAVARGRMFADTFKSKHASQLIHYISKYKISKDRQGRKERVDIIKQFMYDEPQGDEIGLMDRFIKGKG